jgi:hypothetical protein
MCGTPQSDQWPKIKIHDKNALHTNTNQHKSMTCLVGTGRILVQERPETKTWCAFLTQSREGTLINASGKLKHQIHYKTQVPCG